MSVTDRILSALTTVIRMNDKVEEMASLMKEQQRRLDDLHGRVIRLETVLELALHRTTGSGRLIEGDGNPASQPTPPCCWRRRGRSAEGPQLRHQGLHLRAQGR